MSNNLNTTSEECSRMELLTPPLTIVFGALIFIASGIAVVGNALVLYIIFKMKSKKTRSMVILSSLAASDLLVGSILGPITAWQQLDREALEDCFIDQFRGYFVILLVGSSVLTLAVVSYDRYLLLTKLNNYNKYMTKKKAYLFISFSWILPGLIPVVRQLASKIYLSCIFILYVAPLFILGICYFFIMRAVKKKEKSIANRHPTSTNISEDVASSQTPSQITSQVTSHTGSVEYMPTIRKEKKHLRLARAVSLLIICYICCITPMNVWIVLEMIEQNSKVYVYQIIYVCAMLLMQTNSCINPGIYFSKNPDFKRGLKKIFKRKNNSPKKSKVMMVFSSLRRRDDKEK